MFFHPVFLLISTVILAAEVSVLTGIFYNLRGKVVLPSGATAKFIWERQYSQRISRILFPVWLAACLVVDGAGLFIYAKEMKEAQAEAEITKALEPVIKKASSIQRNQICTTTGHLATPETLDSDKSPCAQIGSYRIEGGKSRETVSSTR